jgi:hypothetical protein
MSSTVLIQYIQLINQWDILCKKLYFLLYSGFPRSHCCDGTINYFMTSHFASIVKYYLFIILLFDATWPEIMTVPLNTSLLLNRSKKPHQSFLLRNDLSTHLCPVVRNVSTQKIFKNVAFQLAVTRCMLSTLQLFSFKNECVQIGDLACRTLAQALFRAVMSDYGPSQWFCGLRVWLLWNQNGHNTTKQHLSSHTSPDVCGCF